MPFSALQWVPLQFCLPCSRASNLLHHNLLHPVHPRALLPACRTFCMQVGKVLKGCRSVWTRGYIAVTPPISFNCWKNLEHFKKVTSRFKAFPACRHATAAIILAALSEKLHCSLLKQTSQYLSTLRTVPGDDWWHCISHQSVTILNRSSQHVGVWETPEVMHSQMHGIATAENSCDQAIRSMLVGYVHRSK